MAEQNAVAIQHGEQVNVAVQVKNIISQDTVKKKFAEVLGKKAPQFLASITNVVAGSDQLKKCPANTIMSAAFVAATYAADYYLQNGRDITAALNKARRIGEIDRKAELEKAAREEAEERMREQEAAKTAESIKSPVEAETVQETDKNVQNSAETAQVHPETARTQSESTQTNGEKPGVMDPFADKEADMKIYKASFTIRGTKAQILAVKEFMMKNNIQFGKVEK